MPELLLVGPNPVKKIQRKQNPVVSTPALKRKRNPIEVIKSPVLGKVRRRKNPIGASDIYDLMMQGGIGAAGAVGTDFAAGYILPTLGLQVDYSDPVYMAAKAVMALAAGEILSDATKGLSYQMASGAVTTVITDWARTQIKASAPTVKLGQPPVNGLSNVYVAGSARAGMPMLSGYGTPQNVVLTAQQAAKQPCGCNGNQANGLSGVGRGVGSGIGLQMSGIVDTAPRTFGGVRRRR